METIINDQMFKISKPTIIDRIRGYFELRRYMRRFNADRAARNQAINEMMRK